MKFMKLSMLLLLLVLFQYTPAHAGDTWSARYYSSKNYRARSLAAVADGGYIVAGHTAEPGFLHVQLLRVDRSGGVVWQKTYFSGMSATAYAISATDDGNYVVSAYSYPGTLVFKVSPDGTVLWQSFLGLPASDSDNVRQTKDHGYIVTGYTYNSKAWVVKLDASGNVLWSKTYSYGLAGRTIYEASDGSLYLAGYASSPDVFVAKLSSTGSVIWAKKYGGGDYEMLRSTKPTADGGLIMAGYSSDTSGSTYYNWIMKINSSGDIQWSKKLSTYKQTGGIATQLSDGSYVFISKDAPTVIKFDQSGNLVWQMPAGVIASAEDIITTSDGGYAVTSSSSDIYIFKFGDLDIPVACMSTSDWESVSATNFSAVPLSVVASSVTVVLSPVVSDAVSLAPVMEQVCYIPTPAITLDKSSIPFGSIQLGHYGDSSLTIGNSGKATLSVSGLSLSGSNSGDFLLLGNCAVSLAPGSVCTTPVRFTPASAGDRSASLTITSNDPKHPSLVVPLSGKGVSPHILVSPSPLRFPDTGLPGSSSATLTISNTGDYPLSIGAYTLQGDNAADFSFTGTCGSVAAGGSCLQSVAFTPRGLGSRVATLDVFSDDPVNPKVTIPFSGNGTDTTPPVSSVTVTGMKGNEGWFLSDAVAMITATDTGSGVRAVVYTVKGTPTVTVPGNNASTTFATTNEYELSYFASDVAGNIETPTHVTTVKVDKNAPVTKATLSGPQGNGGWFSGDVTLGLTSTDEGSGMYAVTYKADDATEVSVPGASASFVIGTEGVHTVTYSGKDRAGNIEAGNTVSVSVDKTPPTSTITLNGLRGSNGWFTGDVSVVIRSADSLSGPAEVHYRIDGGVETVVAGSTASFTVKGDGNHTVTWYSVDNAGNVESPRMVTLHIDTIPPVSSVTVTGTKGNEGWLLSDAVATITATDAGSGVQAVVYAVDDKPAVTVPGNNASTTFAATNEYILSYFAGDVAGNTETPTHFTTVKVDKNAPVTTATVSGPQGLGGWFRGDVTVGLHSTDVGSGMYAVTYKADGATEVSVPGASASFVIGTEGVHTVTYSGKDRAGNIEAGNTVSVSVDKTPPTSTITLNGLRGSNGWFTGDVSVVIRSADSLSGPAEVRYRIDGGVETVVAGSTASFTVKGDGHHTITWYSLDNAGNVESARTVDLRIDATPPVSTIGLSGPTGAAGWFTGNVTVTLHSLDSTSGVAELRYSIDDGAETAIHGDTATFTIGDAGAHTIKWHAVDLAGNVENSHATDVRLDKTPPTITITPSRSVLWPPNHKMVDVTIGGSAQDAGSGISSVVLTVTDEYGIITRTLSGFGSSVSLEAWREGGDLDGRHYTVTAVATDLAGNTSTSSAEIIVPHDMR